MELKYVKGAIKLSL